MIISETNGYKLLKNMDDVYCSFQFSSPFKDIGILKKVKIPTKAVTVKADKRYLTFSVDEIVKDELIEVGGSGYLYMMA